MINETESSPNSQFIGEVSQGGSSPQGSSLTVSNDNSLQPQTFNPQTGSSSASLTGDSSGLTQVAGVTDQKAASFSTSQLAGDIDTKPEVQGSGNVLSIVVLLTVLVIAGAAVLYRKYATVRQSAEGK